MKLRRLSLSSELLADFLTNPGSQGAMVNAPRDLRIIDCVWRVNCIELLVSSPDFNDPADVQEPPPMWKPLFCREVVSV
jgi:hypothetical protein